jgi:hypothetical protein
MKTYYLNFFFWKNPTLRRSRKNAPRNSMSFAGLFDIFLFCRMLESIWRKHCILSFDCCVDEKYFVCRHTLIILVYNYVKQIYIYVTCDLHLCNPQHQELKTFKHAAGRCIEEYFVTSNAEEAGNTSADWFISLGVNYVILIWLLRIIIHSYSPWGGYSCNDQPYFHEIG